MNGRYVKCVNASLDEAEPTEEVSTFIQDGGSNSI